MTSSSAALGTGSSPLALPLLGRRIQIAGSASKKTNPALIQYAHEVVAQLVRNIIAAGGGIVVSVGKEPRPEGAPPDAPSLTFDWTALEVAADCIAKDIAGWHSGFKLPIVLVSSEKSASEIPDKRRPLYESLLQQRESPGGINNARISCGCLPAPAPGGIRRCTRRSRRRHRGRAFGGFIYHAPQADDTSRPHYRREQRRRYRRCATLGKGIAREAATLFPLRSFPRRLRRNCSGGTGHAQWQCAPNRHC